MGPQFSLGRTQRDISLSGMVVQWAPRLPQPESKPTQPGPKQMQSNHNRTQRQRKPKQPKTKSYQTLLFVALALGRQCSILSSVCGRVTPLRLCCRVPGTWWSKHEIVSQTWEMEGYATSQFALCMEKRCYQNSKCWLKTQRSSLSGFRPSMLGPRAVEVLLFLWWCGTWQHWGADST